MKYFIKSILALVGALLVSLILLPISFLYSIGYSIWLTISLKNWKSFFIFWVRLIDGTLHCVGHILQEGIALGLDKLWNVNGEIIEDVTTTREDTNFSDPNYSVSASIGAEIINNKITPDGLKLSKILNIVFNQRRHAVDSWLYTSQRIELKKKYFKKL